MNKKHFVVQMKAMIEDIKAKGTASINCDSLVAFLNEVEKTEKDPSPMQFEKYKAELQNWIEINKRNHDGQLEIFRSVITSGQSAIKSSFLLNGGGAVAMLAFVGHLAQFEAAKVPTFSACLLPFAFGVLAIAVTSGLTYLSQWMYASTSPRPRRMGFWLNLLCIFLGCSSYGFFALGLFVTYRWFITYA